MTKKVIKRKKTPSVRKISTVRTSHIKQPIVRLRFIVFGMTSFLLLLLVNLRLENADKPYVLGTSTFLLADHGSDDTSSGSTSPDTNGGSGGSSGSNSGDSFSVDGSNNAASGDSESQTTAVENGSVLPQSFVDCTGPDGRHFQTTFQACQQLNLGWHHQNFSFTLLQTAVKPGQRQHGEHVGKPEAEPAVSGSPENELQPDENGHGNSHLLPEDGGVEIEKTASESFRIRRASTEAETHFPLSVDPTTHALIVTTPAGTKTVTILPDEAVDRAFQTRLINSIQQNAPTQTGTQSAPLTQTELTELNNEPVFAINGFANKKFLGVVPMAFAKTVFISAQTGNVVKTDETFFGKLLETLSF